MFTEITVPWIGVGCICLIVCMCVWESIEHVIVLLRTEVQGREKSSAQLVVLCQQSALTLTKARAPRPAPLTCVLAQKPCHKEFIPPV